MMLEAAGFSAWLNILC